ncbi:MAG: AEC family transporter [Chloroflexi bacterium]|nr:AEC family transporter [Chloroflexota bacterium]
MLELFQIFIDNMIPVLAIAGVGFYLRRRFDTNPAMISRMMFHVFSPALAFNALYTRDISGGDFLRVYFATLALLAAILAFSLVFFRWQNIKSGERATTLVSTFVFNGANFGISIVSFAFGAEALTYAVIIYIAGSTVAWTLGPYVSSSGKASMLKSFQSVLRTPVVYALVVAFSLKAAGIVELPPALSRTSQLLADASIPLMLVLLGLQLGGFRKPDRWRLLLSGTVIRLLLAPLIGVAVASLFSLDGAARLAFILQAGMPTAVLTIILAYEFDTDKDLALSLIMTTTLISPFTLSVIIYLLQNGIV